MLTLLRGCTIIWMPTKRHLSPHAASPSTAFVALQLGKVSNQGWHPLDLQAHSRLASLLLEVRCSQAAVATLESLLQALPESSRTAEQHTAQKSAQQRLQEARSATRRGQKMHHYKLLGLERGCTTEEVSLHCQPELQGHDRHESRR